MKLILNYILSGAKYFIIQTFFEVCLIIILLYLGLPFFEMNVGSEKFYEIVVGVFGFYALTKCIYYSIIYLLLFTTCSYFGKLKTNFSLSLLNALLSVCYFVPFVINGRQLNLIINPIVACVIVAITLSFYTKFKATR
jgi:hypothetical protein